MRSNIRWTIALATALALTGGAQAATIFVEPGASGDGSAWGNALGDVESAIENANQDDEVWIKTGEYSIAGEIEMTNRVSVYGGFVGSEASLTARTDIAGNPTTITAQNTGYRIFYLNNSDGARVDGVIVHGADTTGLGGGIFITGATNNAVIANCVIDGNTADRGGGIFLQGDPLTITSCTIRNNLASLASGPVAEGGGGIYVSAASPVIEKCLILDNTANLSGGGIFFNGDDPSAVMRLEDSIVRGNRSMTTANNNGSGGGGLSFWAYDAFEIVNCLIAENTAEYNGGGAMFRRNNTAGTVRSTTFSANLAKTPSAAGQHDEGGGGFYVLQGASVELIDCWLLDNTAVSNGGGAHCYTGGETLPTQLTMIRCVVEGNVAQAVPDDDQGGGGVGAWTNTSLTNPLQVKLLGCTIANNTADSQGGGVFLRATIDSMIVDCVIAGNTCLATDDARRGGGGVSLFTTYGTNDIATCTVQGNYSAQSGGGMRLRNAPFTMKNCAFLDNEAAATLVDDNSGGGALNVWDTDDGLIEDVRMVGNVSGSHGGGLKVGDSPGLAVTRSDALCNTATELGGGVAVYDSDNVLLDVMTIAGNAAQGANSNNGGGGAYIYNSDSVALTSSVVSGNYATDLAAPQSASGGGLSLRSADAFVGNTVICGNFATVSGSGTIGGAGVLSYQSSPTFFNCLVTGNTCGANAGGMYQKTGQGSATLAHCVLSDNKIGNRGGGLLVSDADAVMANCVISGNTFSSWPAALDEQDASADITCHNCLFFANSGDDFRDEDATNYSGLNVNTVAENQDCIADDPSFVAPLSGTWTFSVDYDSATGLSTLDLGGNFAPGELAGRQINPDIAQPRLAYIRDNTASAAIVPGDLRGWSAGGSVGYEIRSYELQRGSAAINAGTDTVPTAPASSPPGYDLAGAGRPASPSIDPVAIAYDIGAYEVAPVSGEGPASGVGGWTRY